MTRKSNSRLAGYSLLAYIAFGIMTMAVMGRATSGDDMAARLASMAQHTADIRIAAIFTLLTSFCAIVLGVTLWALTRDEDPDLAMLGLTCRFAEGMLGVLAVQRTLELLWLATSSGASALGADELNALATFVYRSPGSGTGSVLFAVGSALFCWLLLRGRMIPSVLAWIGVIASLSWVVGMPMQLVGVLPNAATYPMWVLMAAFEIPFALLLIWKGAAPPARLRAL